jgi:hypothetical protein
MKKYNQFVNENIQSPQDMEEILSYVHDNISSEDIPALISELENLSEMSESINENWFTNIKNRLNRWIDDKLMNRFINKKAKFYVDLASKLKKYDLTTLEDVKQAYPRFNELVSIYLAGGMDKAADVGKGWREVVEWIFEVENQGISHNLEPITISYKGETVELSPAYVVDDYHLDEAIKGGKKYIKENYDLPAIFNPVRKEVDRTKNPEFGAAMGRFKAGEYADDDDFAGISKIFSETIEKDDEKIVVLSDAIFYGANEYSSAGTFGELQQSSFQQIPIFAWYEEGWDIHGHSPWTIPHITKILRTEDDVRTFVNTMINY